MHKQQKVRVVVRANAVREPRTVMIELLDAALAPRAVHRAMTTLARATVRRSIDLARRTELELDEMRTRSDQVVWRLRIFFDCILGNALTRHYARIAESSHHKKHICEKPQDHLADQFH